MINYNKELPLFLIDQEWIVCLDEKCGFVAKFLHFESIHKMNEIVNATKSDYFTFEQFTYLSDKGGILLQIENYLHAMEFSEKNILSLQRLMKFGMKKYVYNLKRHGK